MAPERSYQWQLYEHLLYKSEHVTPQTQNTDRCLHLHHTRTDGEHKSNKTSLFVKRRPNGSHRDRNPGISFYTHQSHADLLFFLSRLLPLVELDNI